MALALLTVLEKVVEKRIHQGLSESSKARCEKQIKQLAFEICQPRGGDLGVWD